MRHHQWISLGLLAAVVGTIVLAGCGGANQQQAVRPATTVVTLSDPTTCQAPKGQFEAVWVTITGVKVHTSSTAGENDPGWIDLIPALKDNPKQVNLFGLADDKCFLATLGSTTQLQPGQYQQIRVLLAENSFFNFTGNVCADVNAANCVVIDALPTDLKFPLLLSSEAKTGIKIPSGQIAGGKFVVDAGTTNDLNIDFDACASILAQGNGGFRLKPVLHAGEVSATQTSIQGRLVDKDTGAPISNAIVALEQRTNGIDRVIMQTTPDSTGNFVFCPIPEGSYEIVAVAIGDSNTSFATTIITGAPSGVALGNIPLAKVSGTSTAPASIAGKVTSAGAGTPVKIDVRLSALQTIDIGGTAVGVTIPLAQQNGSTALIQTDTTGCDPGVACKDYTLSVAAAAPYVGAWAATINYAQVNMNPVAYKVEGRAFQAGSTSTETCTPSSQTTADITVTPGANAAAPTLAFTACTAAP